MKSQSILTIVAILFGVTFAASLSLKDCDSLQKTIQKAVHIKCIHWTAASKLGAASGSASSKHGKATSLTLSPPPVGSCTFPRGKNVTVTVDLEIDEVTKSLHVTVRPDEAVWGPFPFLKSDACTHGVTCPTTSGSSYMFKFQIPVHKEYPSLMTGIRLEFIDDNGEDAICVQFPAHIC